MFTAAYTVTVPGNASPSSYAFTGTLGYHIGGSSLITETIEGDQSVNVQIPGGGGGGGPIPTPGPANCLRQLPGAVSPGQTFDVTVTFTAPADNFNAVGITDNAPAGWSVQGNIAWCTPNASFVNIVGSQISYVWMGTYTSGSAFTAQYKVTVPGNATLPSYTFSGQLGYHIGGGGLITENIAGNSTVKVGQTPVSGITREVNGDI